MRTVVVTGASAGVGRATAIAFGRRGCRVALLARDRAALAAAAREVEQAGGRAIGLVTDVADPAQVEAAAERVERDLGPIDVWVNNAMATIFAPLQRISAEEFRRATEVTYLGAVHGTMSALRRMVPRDHGVIVQVGSALAYRSIPLQAPYCGAKAAIRGFTDSLRCELLHDHSRVRLTMVQLSAHNTPQFDWALSRMPRQPQPVPPIYAPEVAAEAIVFAAEAGRREVWSGWPAVRAIVANMLAPGVIDRYLARTNYDAQQTGQATPDDRPANLFQPAPPALHRTHGRFAARERRGSVQMWLNRRRTPVLAGLGLGLGLAAVLSWRRLTPAPAHGGHTVARPRP